ncbi:hypothetical protein AJ80_09683 [Polytolypa hystricis UAMH7299]|uniref:chitinase n=1 Tax=Polytolypa hystricis (strain UAMH7299) TaxID=1447883 RepID=A0A2B7WLI2_POLH7|nr:hypothetical protein AJ80_09683 [Polytolypa hystricis UAMH7299]
MATLILLLCLVEMAHAYRSVAYFVNWGIYARNYMPADLPANQLTHVNYAFADVNPNSGEIVLSDPYADIEKHFPGDSWSSESEDLFGSLKQLFILKQENRKLKVLLSIGGWGAYSLNLAMAASTPKGRSNFARSAVQLISDLGLDGLDIDWEFPRDKGEADNFLELLRETYEALEQRMGIHGGPVILTAAVSAGPDKYELLDLKAMDQYISFWNLMAYDYAGSWDSATGHQANLFPSPLAARTPFSTEAALDYYIETAGLNGSKINLGIPLYGRAFCGTDGLGLPFCGVGDGSWEDGVWDYKVLPLPGSTEFYDNDAAASYSYDVSKNMLVTYDSVKSVQRKAAYIKQRGLGGVMYWEASGDVADSRSIIAAAAASLGVLDETCNLLTYPTSKYKTIREGGR